MRRLIAAVIDFYLAAFGLYIPVILNAIGFPLIIKNSLFYAIIIFYGYTFYFDYFKSGKTIGKQIMNVHVILNDDSKRRFSVGHAACITLGTAIWPVCVLLYFVGKCSMPYDKWLGVDIF